MPQQPKRSAKSKKKPVQKSNSRPILILSGVAAVLVIGIVAAIVLSMNSGSEPGKPPSNGKSTADAATIKANHEAFLLQTKDKRAIDAFSKDVVLPDIHEFDREAVELAAKEFAANQPFPLAAAAAAGSPTRDAAEKKERKWWNELFVESYSKFGSQNTKWQKQATDFLAASADAFAGPALTDTVAAEVAKGGTSLMQAGCDDPLVQFVYGVLVSRYDRQDNRKLIAQAFTRFPSSRYPLGVVLRTTLPMATRHNWAPLLQAYHEKSQESGKEGLLGADPTAGRGALFKICVQTVPWTQHNQVRDFLIAAYGVPQFDPWLRAMLSAHYFYSINGHPQLDDYQPLMINGVRQRRTPVQRYELQYRYVWNAQAYYLDAWKLDRSQPEAALGLMRSAQMRRQVLQMAASHGVGFPGHEADASGLTGKTIRDTSRFWFDQAVRSRFDQMGAYQLMLTALPASGSGSYDELTKDALAFGRECLATARFDTQVPNFYLDTLRLIEGTVRHQGVYREKGVYEDCEKLVAGYIAVAKTEQEKDSLKSLMVCLSVAGWIGDEAKRILLELGDKADPSVFEARGLILFEVKKSLLEKHPNHRLIPELDIPVLGVAFAGDDDSLLLAEGKSRSTRRWSLKKGTATGTFLHEDDMALEVAASSDGKTIATTGTKGPVHLWNAQSGKRLRSLAHEAHVRILCFSPQGTLLATSTGSGEGNGGTVRVWNVASGKELARRTSPAARFNSIAFSPDGKTLAVVGGSYISASSFLPGEIVLWDFKTDQFTPLPQLFEVATHGIVISPDGRFLAATGFGLNDTIDRNSPKAFPAEIAVVELPGGTVVRRWKLPEGIFSGCAFLGNGETLAASGPDLMIRIWNVADGRLVAELSGHRQAITALAVSPKRTRLMSRENTGSIRVWDVSGATTPSQAQGDLFSVRLVQPNRVYVDPQWKYVAAGGREVGVVFWDRASNWNVSAVFPVHDELRARDFDISPDGKTLVIVGEAVKDESAEFKASIGGVIQLWDIPNRKPLKRLEGNQHSVSCARFSPDGRMLATGSDDQRVVIWNTETGKPFEWGELKEHTGPITRLEFARSGRLLATGDEKRTPPAQLTAKVWKLPDDPLKPGNRMSSLRTIADFKSFGGLVLKFSQDGKQLFATDGETGSVYDTSTWKKTLEVKGRNGDFSANGKQLLTTDFDKVRLWQTSANQLPQEFKVNGSQFWSYIVPTPVGSHFLAAHRIDSRIVLWDAASHAVTETMPDISSTPPKRP